MSYNESEASRELAKRYRQDFRLYAMGAGALGVMMVACILLVALLDLSKASLAFAVLAVWSGKWAGRSLAKARAAQAAMQRQTS